LHEGCRYRVLSSSGVETLPGAEDEMVLRLIDSGREGPRDLRAFSANEEEAIHLKILHDLRGAGSRDSQRPRDVVNRERLAARWQLPHNEDTHCVVVWGHELETLPDALWSRVKLLLPVALSSRRDLISVADENGL
jgi:hypothetical protein